MRCLVHLDYRDARPIYSQIVDEFRLQITEGILRHGEKMPSVRELAAQLAINPNTIQRAYRELEMQGLIASVPGKGSFVCGGPTSAGTEQKALWQTLDEAVRQLKDMGVGTEELLRHIRQGGKYDD